MESEPATENGAAAAVNRILRGAVDLGTRAASVAAKTAVPVLRLPILSQLTDLVVDRVGDFIYKFFAEHATFIVIDLQTIKEKNDYLASVDRLKAAQATGDTHAIDEARKKFKDDLARLIHWDGHASP